uniref:Putative SWI/SNF-related matrix-associated actin-dependent regulator of chromatin subfamily A member 3-like 1 n=1 Tax=Talaromyces marneffei PM1 TaxID=1077442 RepID=A0A093VGA7_TALMA
MERGLKDLAMEPLIEFDALVNLQILGDAIRRAQKQSDAAIRVDVNIYGPEASRDRVGKYLSDKGLFLQPPNERRRGTRYDNPHILQLDDLGGSDTEEDNSDSDVASSDASSEQNEDFQETIAEVFNSLTRSDDLRGVRGSEGLNRTLYPHQEEALFFMLQRETGDIPDKYRLWQPEIIDGAQKYRHVITKAQQDELPDESGGGILADEMGMGKSLTTLVLIEKTLSDALKWAEERKTQSDDLMAKRHCRATLVIVPSHVLINMWTREVEEHLDGSLRVFKYHGKDRKKHLSEIEHYDIVITTYNTLAREHGIKNNGGSQSPLHEVEWYRVVLDEAHMIRRQATTFHHAVRDLSAKSRWCLSGTPIQNSLIDLGALLVFIQAKPFHHLGIFRYWISNPFEARSTRHRAIERLALLLEGICLRRTIERVALPGRREETHVVEFTPAERKHYKDTNRAMQRFIIQKVGEYNEQKTFGMFQIFLQLRSLCNHGTYQRPFSWTKKILFDEEADPVCSITRDSLARCVGCREPLPLISSESRPAYAENCKHVLCQECSPATEDSSDPGIRPNCPICKSRRVMPFSLSRNNHPQSRESTDTENDDDGYLRSNGYSSKMTMLVSDVQKALNTTKSIIFSCWTRTLDLIGKHLSSANIEYARIDGKTPLSQRQKILDSFDRTRNIPILIMTTGTGALGLNLKSVNRVFIIEPQWNPAVESQAIARAIRLGQTEQVLVIRYHVKGSIEENMCEQQTQKLKISKMDFRKDFLTIPSSVSNADSETVSGQATPESSSDMATTLLYNPDRTQAFFVSRLGQLLNITIDPIQIKTNAVLCCLDEVWHDAPQYYGKCEGDNNAYLFGRSGRHDVVVVTLAGEGRVNAASSAQSLKMSFNSIKLALLVGICGAIPLKKDGTEILLGDVIISEVIVDLSHGRQYPGGFNRKDTLLDVYGRPDEQILGLIRTWKTALLLDKLREETKNNLTTLLGHPHLQTEYPGAWEDKLFPPQYVHMHHSDCIACLSGFACEDSLTSSCTDLNCDVNMLVHRERLLEIFNLYPEMPTPFIHFGSIGTGDTVMKSATHREEIANAENVIAFEMEGAGIWDKFSCLVIKGVCDYADSHKNKNWQSYAASVAASAMKVVLGQYVTSQRQSGPGESIVNSGIPTDAAVTPQNLPVLPGTHTPQALFDNILNTFERCFDQEQWLGFKTTSASSLKRSLKKIQDEQKASKSIQNLRRMESFLKGVENLGKLMEEALGIPGFIAKGHPDLLEAYLSAYDKIGAALPTFEDCHESFKHHTGLQRVLAEVFGNILEIHHRMTKLFCGRALKDTFKPLWKDFQHCFEHILHQLRSHKALIEDEARVPTNTLRDMSADSQHIRDHIQQIAGNSFEFDRKERERQKALYNEVRDWFSYSRNLPENAEVESEHGRYCYDREQYTDTGGWILSHEKIQKWLSPDVQQSSHSMLWINGRPGTDAVDECQSSEEAKNLLDTFKDLTKKCDNHSPGKLRVLFLSQPTSEIRNSLVSADTLTLTPELNVGDIRKYCQHRTRELEKFEFSSEDIKNVVEIICARADGMFLFAKLVMNNLAKQPNLALFRDEITGARLPNEIDQAVLTKSQIFPNNGASRARSGLRTVQVHAVVARMLRDDVHEICGSLVQVLQGDRVELVHSTARRFIIEQSGIDIATAECDLTLRCLRYLTLNIFEPNIRDSDLRFYALRGDLAFQDYAVSTWFMHVKSMVDTNLGLMVRNPASSELNDQLIKIRHVLGRFIQFYDASFPDDNIQQQTQQDCEAFWQFPFHADLVKIWQHIRSEQNKDLVARNNVSIDLLNKSLKRNRQLLEKLGTTEDVDLSIIYGDCIFRCPKVLCFFFHEGFKTAQARESHVDRHERPFHCTVENCTTEGLGLASESALRRHLRTFHPEQCDLSESFTRLSRGPTSQARWECHIEAKGRGHVRNVGGGLQEDTI